MTTVPSAKPEPEGELLAAAVSVTLALAVGAVGGLATASSLASWYAGLAKPAFNPPNVVFGPVWTALYVLMALAAWRVWRARRSGPGVAGPLALYGVQLGLNLAWTVIFFGLRRPGAALVEVAVLMAAILATAGAFWRADRLAGLMMAPYAAWVAFASLLNFEIWRLN